MKRNREHLYLRLLLMAVWVIFACLFMIFALPQVTPENPAAPEQTATVFILIFGLVPFILISAKLFPFIELPTNKILAYHFYQLGTRLEGYNRSSGEFKIIEIPEIKKSLKSCGEELESVLSGLPSLWTKDIKYSLQDLQSAIYKINYKINARENINEKLIREISGLSETLQKEETFSPLLKRRISVIGSLSRGPKEPLRIFISSRLSKSITGFPQWWRSRSMGVRFFINCLIFIPIGCGATYFFSMNVFPEVSINYVYAAVVVVMTACIGASAVLAR